MLIKFPFQRLSLYDPFPPSLSSQHSTDLLTRVIHFLQARAIISKPQFQPFFFTVFTEESLGQVFQNGIAEKVSKAGRTAACNQGVMLVERRECRKILPPPWFFYMLTQASGTSRLWWDLQKDALFPALEAGSHSDAQTGTELAFTAWKEFL